MSPFPLSSVPRLTKYNFVFFRGNRLVQQKGGRPKSQPRSITPPPADEPPLPERVFTPIPSYILWHGQFTPPPAWDPHAPTPARITEEDLGTVLSFFDLFMPRF